MKRDGIASDNQPMLAAHIAQDETISGEPEHAESIQPQALLERVLERVVRNRLKMRIYAV